MKTALCTTTIHVPVALAAFRELDADVRFFVAADWNTPGAAIDFCQSVVNTQCIVVDEQQRWKCSDLIGWRNIQRRNIAILEALAWGAECLVLWDDDNLFTLKNYFRAFEWTLDSPYTGIAVSGFNHWFDVGQLLTPRAPHRGFPIGINALWRAESVVNAKVGVAAGICMGDPDVSAVERIANRPIVHGVSELLRAGIVVDPGTWTVFNSQNTALLRQFAPCFLLCPQFGRYDDIFASLVAQRVMREFGYVVHFGQPFIWQARNEHNLVVDLRAEMLGMEHIVEFAAFLDNIAFTPGNVSVIAMVRHIYASADCLNWMPSTIHALAKAWCDDCEAALV